MCCLQKPLKGLNRWETHLKDCTERLEERERERERAGEVFPAHPLYGSNPGVQGGKRISDLIGCDCLQWCRKGVPRLHMKAEGRVRDPLLRSALSTD